MTELQYLQALVAVIALTMFAAIALAAGTGRSVGERILRALAVCAEISLMLFLAWPG